MDLLHQFDGSHLIYAALGAIFGAWMNNSLQVKRIIKEQKMQALKDLMVTRFDSPVDQRAAETINFMCVLFADNAKVTKAYEDYHEALLNKGKDLSYKFNGLIAAIAKDVGIAFKPLDLMRTPIFSFQRKIEDHKCREEYNQLFPQEKI